MPLTVLFSVLALMERTPESMGEETVQSNTEGGVASAELGSVVEVGTGPCSGCAMSVKVVDCGVGVGTMSVTGRMVGVDVVALTLSRAGGEGESAGGIWSGSVGEGETGADISLSQGAAESTSAGSESTTGGTSESLEEGVDVDSSTISK